eukprot:TRINITY_DN10817_c0_g1_i9.p1 TRINITY_DN10817_c0_g1~~TRINITY_DN10817_c0_g1_i9.p1  ORF type:complete len:119 (-),score=19.42 TRINITY_DN10817_c0_g1_i9:47-403(-)
MKLLTYILTVCNSASCQGKDFPLELKYTNIVTKEAEYDKEFVQKLLSRLNWPLLVSIAKTLPNALTLPEELTPELEQNDELLQLLHKTLLETHVMEGELMCTSCKLSLIHICRCRRAI